MHLVSEGLAIHKLHRDEMNTVCLADFVYVGNVRMVECGSGAGFLLEASHSIFVGREFWGQNF
jgi:hypothetical protein